MGKGEVYGGGVLACSRIRVGDASVEGLIMGSALGTVVIERGWKYIRVCGVVKGVGTDG